MPEDQSNPLIEQTQADFKGIFSVGELMHTDFLEISYLAEGMIPEGLTILAGKPKIGKSWIALDLCLSVALNKRRFMGQVECLNGDVLYLALEDNPRRLQSRLKKMLGTEWNKVHRLEFAIEWPAPYLVERSTKPCQMTGASSAVSSRH